MHNNEIDSTYSNLTKAVKKMELLNYNCILKQIQNNLEINIEFSVQEYEIDISLSKLILFDPTIIREIEDKSKQIYYITQKIMELSDVFYEKTDFSTKNEYEKDFSTNIEYSSSDVYSDKKQRYRI